MCIVCELCGITDEMSAEEKADAMKNLPAGLINLPTDQRAVIVGQLVLESVARAMYMHSHKSVGIKEEEAEAAWHEDRKIRGVGVRTACLETVEEVVLNLLSVSESKKLREYMPMEYIATYSASGSEVTADAMLLYAALAGAEYAILSTEEADD